MLGDLDLLHNAARESHKRASDTGSAVPRLSSEPIAIRGAAAMTQPLTSSDAADCCEPLAPPSLFGVGGMSLDRRYSMNGSGRGLARSSFDGISSFVLGNLRSQGGLGLPLGPSPTLSLSSSFRSSTSN